MKTFNRSYLPETITYNKVKYKYNATVSGNMSANSIALSILETDLRLKGMKAIRVQVLSRNLKGKTDLHNRPYKPTNHIYTNY